MNYSYDILLNKDNDLDIASGDFVVAESTLQEVGIIIQLNPGELKSDPVLAPSLVQLLNSNAKPQEIKERLSLHLLRDGKNYDDVKELINFNTIQL